VGRAGRDAVSIDPIVLLPSNRSIHGTSMTDCVHDRFKRTARAATGQRVVAIDSEFAFERRVEVHAHIESRKAFGQLISML
jgi:hypothetical protein